MKVPPAAQWQDFSDCIHEFLAAHPQVPPLSLIDLRECADHLLRTTPLDPNCRDFLIVQLNNAIWEPVVASIPFERRVLMLPPCLRSSTDCPATFDTYGLLCANCGRCCIGSISREAESLGYAVLVVESTSLVQPFLDQGDADAVIGIGCMVSLERSFDHIVTGAIPGLAIPLLRDGCKDTTVSDGQVRSLLHIENRNASLAYPDYQALRRQVDSWFEPDALQSLGITPLTPTEQIGIDWLAKAGKRWRPFLTTATYAALTDCPASALPDSVRRTTIAVECLHKASLIFDDIQDNDALRYGEQTLHHLHGIPLALTAGLHLLGLGYRLIADSGAPPSAIAAMMSLISQAHLHLCSGQGAELWAVRHPTLPSTAELLDIFRKKTAPAFNVGLRLGAILANASSLDPVLLAFGDALGTAYQIRDDIDDNRDDAPDNDITAGRPSILVTLAAEHAPEPLRERMRLATEGKMADRIALYREAIALTGSEALARRELEGYKQAALKALRPLQNSNLKILMHRVVAKAL
jgi:geranylgeranyl pyrophosphate synthase